MLQVVDFQNIRIHEVPAALQGALFPGPWTSFSGPGLSRLEPGDSGKASSAACLTAAMVRDEESGEFVIEAGAHVGWLRFNVPAIQYVHIQENGVK